MKQIENIEGIPLVNDMLYALFGHFAALNGCEGCLYKDKEGHLLCARNCERNNCNKTMRDLQAAKMRLLVKNIEGCDSEFAVIQKKWEDRKRLNHYLMHNLIKK